MPQASPNGLPIIPEFAYMMKHQPDAVLNQANPVQNTWYTVLPATDDVRIIGIGIIIRTANETLELRIVIDGVTLIQTVAAVFGTTYYTVIRPYSGGSGLEGLITSADNRAFLLEGQSVSVSIRKTTAVGAGNIEACVCWTRLLPT